LKKLEDIIEHVGIESDVIYEGILTTFNEEHSVNIAAMGFTYSGGLFTLKPFKTTRTYKNIMRTGKCTLNLFTSAISFFTATFKELSDDKFTIIEADNWPHLKEAHACIDLIVVGTRNFDERAEIICKPVRITFNRKKKEVLVFTRVEHSLVEATIHATRVLAFLQQGKIEEAMELRRLIEHYFRLIQRIAPKSKHLVYIKRLVEYLDKKLEDYLP